VFIASSVRQLVVGLTTVIQLRRIQRESPGAQPTATIISEYAASVAITCYPAVGHGSTCLMSTCRPMSVKSEVLSVTIVAPNSRADAAIKMS
jgi:hypothetical protein